MNHRIYSLLLAACAWASTTHAASIDQLQNLVQSEFRALSEDMVSALSYKSVSPAEPLGITGFDLGVELSVMRMENSAFWQKATGSKVGYLPVPKIAFHKGLPFDIDVGVFYTRVPRVDIELYGAELKYAILAGSALTPAVAIRAAGTKLKGVEQLDLDTRSLELAVSKGLAMFTPYAGIGRVWGDATPKNVTAFGTTLPMRKESLSMNRIHAGLNFNVLLGNLAIEAEKTGNNTGASVKLGIRW